jgi:hypothetical protein
MAVYLGLEFGDFHDQWGRVNGVERQGKMADLVVGMYADIKGDDTYI